MLFFVETGNNSGVIVNPDIALEYFKNGFVVYKDDTKKLKLSEREIKDAISKLSVGKKAVVIDGGM